MRFDFSGTAEQKLEKIDNTMAALKGSRRIPSEELRKLDRQLTDDCRLGERNPEVRERLLDLRVAVDSMLPPPGPAPVHRFRPGRDSYPTIPLQVQRLRII